MEVGNETAGMEQCLDKMAAIFAEEWADPLARA
jgi:hypothetical protein